MTEAQLKRMLKDINWMLQETRNSLKQLETMRSDLEQQKEAAEQSQLTYDLESVSIERAKVSAQNCLFDLHKQRKIILEMLQQDHDK